jgi:hypothetical protein
MSGGRAGDRKSLIRIESQRNRHEYQSDQNDCGTHNESEVGPIAAIILGTAHRKASISCDRPNHHHHRCRRFGM